MMQHFYILSLAVEGIKNIETPLEIRFYKESILKDFDPSKYNIKAIYGENGSGKTAIITAVQLLKNILTDKTYLNDTLTQKNIVESINKKQKAGFIQIEYYLCGTTTNSIENYRIDFEIRKDNRFYITSEKMKTKNGNYSQNQYKTVFETQNGRLVNFGPSKFFDFFANMTQNLLEQRSLATFLTDIDVDKLPEENSTEFIHTILLNFFIGSVNVFIDEADDHRRYAFSKLTTEMPRDIIDEPISIIYKEINNQMATLSWDNRKLVLKKNIDVFKNTIKKMCAFIQIFKTELQDIIVETKEGEDAYQCNLVMKYKDYTIDSEYESRGIKKLMDLYVVLNQACKGDIAFIDELDASINDVYLGKLLEFFAYYGGGQLCFTAHNLSPMKFLKKRKNSISFISSVNTIHTWASDGNRSPENAYRDGFIEDSPFNVEASDFLGILGGTNE